MAEIPEETLERVKSVLQDETARQLLHRHFSADCFNRCWGLIDREERSDEETEAMRLLAHASLWHWTEREDCRPVNLSVAYWQLGRVHCLAGDLERARHYGERCVDLSREAGLSPFYIGYGYEVLAHAAILAGDAEGAAKSLGLAESELERIESEEEKGLIAPDLARLRQQLEGLER